MQIWTGLELSDNDISHCGVVSKQLPWRSRSNTTARCTAPQGSTSIMVNAIILAPPRLFSRRFREGISFPNFVKRSILELTLSEVSAVPLPLQNRAFFEWRKRGKSAEKRRGRGVASKRGKKEKRTRENRSATDLII